MNKIKILVVFFSCIIFSCQEKIKEDATESITKVEDTVIVHEEYTEP